MKGAGEEHAIELWSSEKYAATPSARLPPPPLSDPKDGRGKSFPGKPAQVLQFQMYRVGNGTERKEPDASQTVTPNSVSYVPILLRETLRFRFRKHSWGRVTSSCPLS